MQYDALVVGAGYAGAITARRLAEDGGKKGPFFPFYPRHFKKGGKAGGTHKNTPLPPPRTRGGRAPAGRPAPRKKKKTRPRHNLFCQP